MQPHAPRRIVLVVHPGFQILDLAGPHEVFAGANQIHPDSYELHVVSNGGGLVESESGLGLYTADLRTLDSTDVGSIDTVLVAGGAGVQLARSDVELVDWLRSVATRTRRVGSVCSGTFLLGEAGLIDDRRVTTHWARAEQLARDFPAAHVDANPIHVHDGIWTSAGVTAGIDLALALVEDDLGVDCAQTVAQWLVMFLRRPGGQSQFAAPVWDRPADTDGIRRAVDAVRSDPADDHSVGSMARTAAMSSRNFTRVFTREIGVSPGRFVERVRVDTARQLLESTSLTTDAVAHACGFGTGETMRRSFVRCVGTPPGTYRRRFTHLPHIDRFHDDRKAIA